jgi:hypothetical protein
MRPKAHTEIRGAPAPAPLSNLYWSVPDVYSLRGGAAVNLLPDHGLSASLGVRYDGIPVHDLVGGGDENTIKRAAKIFFVEPGLSYTHGRNYVSVSVPWRVKVNRVKSLTEQQPGALPNAAGSRST